MFIVTTVYQSNEKKTTTTFLPFEDFKSLKY